MTSPLASNPLGLANPLFKLEYPQSIGVYTSYGDAQKAVDSLADQNFPVGNLAIVGTDLKLIERVTGRKTWGTVLTQGVSSGLSTALMVALIMWLINPEPVSYTHLDVYKRQILDKALHQLLSDVYWGDLDFLLLDLPPGTGDVAMSLGTKLPNAEVIVVTTPQQASAEVAERAGTMASMMEQKVLGVIENMAYLDTVCPHCDQPHRVDVFGTGGGRNVSDALTTRLGYEVPLLADCLLYTSRCV